MTLRKKRAVSVLLHVFVGKSVGKYKDVESKLKGSVNTIENTNLDLEFTYTQFLAVI